MEKKKETTLRCVTVLTVIAVVCGLLLAVLYPLLYVAPSVASISDNVTAAELGLDDGAAIEWQKLELDAEYSEGNGGSVVMAAKAVSDGNEFFGLLLKTKPAGKLEECTYSAYFRKSDDMFIKLVIVDNGATSGRDFEYALANDKLKNVKAFDYYYRIIDRPADEVFGAFEKPKCGATNTVTAIDRAFRIAANYYYYALGGEAQ